MIEYYAWEQRKLGEVADVIGGGTPSTSVSEYWDGEIDWYAPAEIGNDIFVNSSKRKITKLGLGKSSAKVLPIGTVLFTSRAGIGNTAILSKDGATNQGFQSIIPKVNQLESYFIYSRTSELKKYGEITGAGSTFVEVSGKQMAKMPIVIPKINEQTKIGNFFKRLDETITLQERLLKCLINTSLFCHYLGFPTLE
ncbi:MAG TPA: restriction endonuclease subunit S [Vagococcus sp.]|nr:restriction endonuclease subunit S [Vagococcus sp.]HCM90008.1 restriction endonuclease subunit S [Vagococcus sp.]